MAAQTDDPTLEEEQQPPPIIDRSIGARPYVPSAPADAAPTQFQKPTPVQQQQPGPLLPPGPMAPKPPLLVYPTRQENIVARQFRQQQNFQDQAARFSDRVTYDKQQATLREQQRQEAATRAEQATTYNAQEAEKIVVNREQRNTFKSQGVETQENPDTGLVEPARDEKGALQFKANMSPEDKQLKSDTELHAAGANAMGQRIYEAAREKANTIRDVTGTGAQLTKMQQDLSNLEKNPALNETRPGGGWMGTQFRAGPSDNAMALQKQRDDLKAQIDGLTRKGYTPIDPKTGDVSTALKSLMPDTEVGRRYAAANEAHTAATSERKAWGEVAPKKGGDIEQLIEDRTADVLSAGGNPETDHVLSAIKDRRAELGIPEPTPEEQALKADPVYGPAVAKAREQLANGQAQMAPIQTRANKLLSRLESVVGFQTNPVTADQGDPDARLGVLRAFTDHLTDPAQKGKVNTLLTALEPTLSQLRQSKNALQPVVNAHDALQSEWKKKFAADNAPDEKTQQPDATAPAGPGAAPGPGPESQQPPPASTVPTTTGSTSQPTAETITPADHNKETPAAIDLFSGMPVYPSQMKPGVVESMFSNFLQKSMESLSTIIKGAAGLAVQHPNLPNDSSAKEKMEWLQKSPDPILQWARQAPEKAKQLFPVSPEQSEKFAVKAAGEAGGFAAPALSGPFAPFTMAMQSAGEHINSDYDQLIKSGMSPKAAAEETFKRATASGLTSEVIWSVLPTPLRKLGDKYLIDKFGAAGVKRFLLGRAAALGEGAVLGASTRIGENTASGEEMFKGVGESTAGMAGLQMLFPRGKTPLEEQRAQGAKPGVTAMESRDPEVAAKLAEERAKPTPEAAHAEINGLQPSEHMAPEQTEATQHALRGLMKIAQGQPLEALTATERVALLKKDENGVARVEMVRGPDGKQKPVITDGTLQKVRNVAPQTAQLLPEDETSQRRAILTPPAAEESSKNEPKNSENIPADIQKRSGLLSKVLQRNGVDEETATAFANKFVSDRGADEPAYDQRDAVKEEFAKAGGKFTETGERDPTIDQANKAVREQIQRVAAAPETYGTTGGKEKAAIAKPGGAAVDEKAGGVGPAGGKRESASAGESAQTAKQTGAEPKLEIGKAKGESEAGTRTHVDESIDQAFEGRKADFKRAGINTITESDDAFGATGVREKPDGTRELLVNRKVARQWFGKLGPEKARALIEKGFEEESKHAIERKVARDNGTDTASLYKDWAKKNPDQEKILADAYGKGWEKYSDDEKSAELSRMILQSRATGKTTEQTWLGPDRAGAVDRALKEFKEPVRLTDKLREHIAKVLEYLRGIKNPSKAILEHIKEVERVEKEAADTKSVPSSSKLVIPKPDVAAEGRKFSTRPAFDKFGSETTPIAAAIINDHGGLISKSEAKKTGRFEGKSDLWDDAPALKHPTHNKIYSPNGVMPDEAAQGLHDAGLIKEPTVGAMWDALGKESQSARSAAKTEKDAAVEAATTGKQTSDFESAAADKSKPEVDAKDLQVGDTVRVGTESMKVTEIDPDNFDVTLEDGKKFGIQTVKDNEVIYGEHKAVERPSGEELFPAKKTPFNLAGETEEPAKPTESTTAFGNETLSQQEMFGIQQITELKDPGKSADAAEQIHGDPATAAKAIERQLLIIDSDPATKKSFAKEQRERLGEVVALLRQRAEPGSATSRSSTGDTARTIEGARSPDAESRPAPVQPERKLTDIANTVGTDLHKQLIFPEGATSVRVTDEKGRTTVMPIKSLSGMNPLQGAGPWKKIEAGTITVAKGKRGEFAPIKGEVKVKPQAEGVLKMAEPQPDRDKIVEPFYSQLTRTIEKMPQETMTIGQAKSAVIKGSKADEQKMSRIFTDPLSPLGGWPEDKTTASKLSDKVTKSELLSYALERQAKVRDVVLGADHSEAMQKFLASKQTSNIAPESAPTTPEEWTKLSDKLERVAKQWQANGDAAKADRYFSLSEEAGLIAGGVNPNTGSTAGVPHFSQYQLPGANSGSYRERFVTWPKENELSKLTPAEAELKKLIAKTWTRDPLSVGEEARMGNLQKQVGVSMAGKLTAGWNDGHPQYSDIANPIVRIRRNIRTDADGKKTYFIEEMQGPGKAEQEKMPPELRKRIYEIGMKRALRDAADEGADKIAWTTGKQQADRYDISKQIGEITWHKNKTPDGYSDGVRIVAITPDHGEVVMDQWIANDKLADAVGKDIAAKIIADEGKTSDDKYSASGTLGGLDLKQGGEGLGRLYDQTLPRIANDIGKKFGAKVQKGDVRTANPEAPEWGLSYADAPSDFRYKGMTKAEAEKRAIEVAEENPEHDALVARPIGGNEVENVHTLPIPQALRDSVRNEGQTLFMAEPHGEEPSDSELKPGELFQKHLPLADVMARGYSNIPGVDAADVQQHARMALARAARKFDPMRGTSLSRAIKYDGKQPKDYERSSTQVTLSKEEAKPFIDFGKTIPDKEIMEDTGDSFGGGREDEPHVTALYGITQASPNDAAKTVLDHTTGSIAATVGKLSMFKTPKYDVLKADIVSPQLESINTALRKNVPFENDFPDYHPHLTIAYLKHGEAAKYVGDPRFEGTPLKFDTLDFRSKDGRKFKIDLSKPAGVESDFAALAKRSIRNELNALYRGQTKKAAEQTTLDAPLSEESETTGKELIPDTGRTPAEQTAYDEGIRILRQAIDELPTKMRAVMSRLALGDEPENIARDLGIVKQGVSNIKKAALRRLRGKLGEKGITDIDDDGILQMARPAPELPDEPKENRIGVGDQVKDAATGKTGKITHIKGNRAVIALDEGGNAAVSMDSLSAEEARGKIPTKIADAVKAITNILRGTNHSKAVRDLESLGVLDEATQHVGARNYVPKMVKVIMHDVFGDRINDREFVQKVGAAIRDDNILGGYDDLRTELKALQQKETPTPAELGEITKLSKRITDIESAHDLGALEKNVLSAYKDRSMHTAINRYEESVTPEMDKLYNEMKGLDPATPRETRGRHFEARVNLLTKQNEARMADFVNVDKPMPEMGASNYRNPDVKRDKFDRRAKYTGDYSDNLEMTMLNSFGHRVNEVTKQRLYNALVEKGQARILEEGENAPEEINGQPAAVLQIKRPQTLEGKTQQVNERMLVARSKVETLRRVLNTDLAVSQNPVLRALTKTQILGVADATAHTKNQLSVIQNTLGRDSNFKAVVSRIPVFGSIEAFREIRSVAKEVSEGGAGIAREEAELAKNAMLRNSPQESGVLHYASNFLHENDVAARIILARRYDNLVKAGLAKPGIDGKRAFVMQIGEYNRRLMRSLESSLRDYGASPFIVAGQTFNRFGARVVLGEPGFEAKTSAGSIYARTAMLTPLLGGLLTTVTANMLLSGTVFGRKGTPIGAIDLGPGYDDERGTRKMIDLFQITGIRRGLRRMGLDAVLNRLNNDEGMNEVMGKSVSDIITTAGHPYIGPGAGALFETATGKRLDFRQGWQRNFEARTYDGGRQYLENARAALKHLNIAAYSLTNPAIGAALKLGGVNMPEEESGYGKGILESVVKSPASAFGYKETSSPAVQLARTLRERTEGSMTAEQAEKSKLHSELTKTARSGDVTPVRQAVLDGRITRGEAQNLLARARLTPFQATVHGLKKLDEMLRVYEKATDTEKTELRPILQKKNDDDHKKGELSVNEYFANKTKLAGEKVPQVTRPVLHSKPVMPRPAPAMAGAR